MALIYTILPDGRLLIPPVNPQWWSEGDHVTFDKLNYFMGQAGAFLAARPLYQGLGTSSTTTPVGRTSIALQTDIIDSAGGHNPASNNTQYVIPETGNGEGTTQVVDYYLCIGYIPFSSNDSADIYLAQLVANGTGQTYHSGMDVPGGSGHAVTTMVVDIVSAEGLPTGGPYLTLDAYVYPTNGSSTSTGSKTPSLTVMWVGAPWLWTPLQSPVATPHTWVDADEATAYATGSSSQPGGQKVPLNTEVMQNTAFHTAPPVFRGDGSASTAQSAASGSWTSVQIPHMDIDTFNGWSSGANTQYTVKQPGLYMISGTVCWTEPTTHTGYRACRLRVNGDNTQVYGGNCIQAGGDNSGDTQAITVADLIQLNAGDYVEVQFSHTQGSSISLDNFGESYMIAAWMSL